MRKSSPSRRSSPGCAWRCISNQPTAPHGARAGVLQAREPRWGNLIGDIDESEAKTAAIRGDNETHGPIIIRQVKYRNHVVEQDHRTGKRVTCPMLGLKMARGAPGTMITLAILSRQEGESPVCWMHTRTVMLS